MNGAAPTGVGEQRMNKTERWSPVQYNKFRAQRMQPFFDLTGYVNRRPGMRVIDLGCGTGELTAMLADMLADSLVEGIDSSEEMLEQASKRSRDRLTFRLEDVARIEDYGAYDLVFSHAALHWIPDNHSIVSRMLGTMKPGAQIAIQVPMNENHPSHRIPAEMAKEPGFSNLLHEYVRYNYALSLEQYSTLLYDHGLTDQVCIEKMYGHELPNSDDVIEWVKGTSLNAYLSRLDETGKSQFLAEYRRRLIDEIGDHSPYFYPFRRLLFWGQKP
jgi:trans-aconitate 2-methyltransferase